LQADSGVTRIEDAKALPALWGVFFTATSFLTTTGYISSEWQTGAAWSGIGTPGLVLLGPCNYRWRHGDHAGGVKLLRVYALLRHGERELERIIHPKFHRAWRHRGTPASPRRGATGLGLLHAFRRSMP
jgi:trk system potassium uptake protein